MIEVFEADGLAFALNVAMKDATLQSLRGQPVRVYAKRGRTLATGAAQVGADDDKQILGMFQRWALKAGVWRVQVLAGIRTVADFDATIHPSIVPRGEVVAPYTVGGGRATVGLDADGTGGVAVGGQGIAAFALDADAEGRVGVSGQGIAELALDADGRIVVGPAPVGGQGASSTRVDTDAEARALARGQGGGGTEIDTDATATATAPGVVTGGGQSAVPVGGAGTGRAEVRGDGAETLVPDADGTGRAAIVGQGAGAVDVVEGGAGRVGVAGQGGSSVPIGGAGAGVTADNPPPAIAANQWSMTAERNGTVAGRPTTPTLTILQVPANILRTEYQMDTGGGFGPWQPLGNSAGPGVYVLPDSATPTLVGVNVRAVNAAGPGPESTAKVLQVMALTTGALLSYANGVVTIAPPVYSPPADSVTYAALVESEIVAVGGPVAAPTLPAPEGGTVEVMQVASKAGYVTRRGVTRQSFAVNTPPVITKVAGKLQWNGSAGTLERTQDGKIAWFFADTPPPPPNPDPTPGGTSGFEQPGPDLAAQSVDGNAAFAGEVTWRVEDM